MANFVFNVGKGRVAEKAADGDDLRLLVLKAAGTDAAHTDITTVQALLALGSTTEADFTNYSRKTLAGIQVNVDHATDSVSVTASNVVFTAAGGASNNSCVDVVIFQHITNDAGSIPLIQLDAVFTTDGNDVTLQFGANGFFGAS